jgi:hypothetical protein
MLRALIADDYIRVTNPDPHVERGFLRDRRVTLYSRMVR